MGRIKTDRICPKCKRGKLIECIEDDIAYDGSKTVDVYWECDNCKEWFWCDDLKRYREVTKAEN